MLLIKSERNTVVARATLSGEVKGTERNRAMLVWLAACPFPDAIELNLLGARTRVECLFGGAVREAIAEHDGSSYKHNVVQIVERKQQ